MSLRVAVEVVIRPLRARVRRDKAAGGGPGCEVLGGLQTSTPRWQMHGFILFVLNGKCTWIEVLNFRDGFAQGTTPGVHNFPSLVKAV